MSLFQTGIREVVDNYLLEESKNLYDTSNLGVDGNTVHGAGGVLRRAVNSLVRR